MSLTPTQLYPVSTRFLHAARASTQRIAYKIEVFHGTEFKEDITKHVTAASVHVDSTSQNRRQTSVTIHSDGYPYDELVPRAVGDLLHPASCNELHISRGFHYTDGTSELAPLGIFRLSKPVVQDTDEAITITISGTDRSTIFQRRKFYEPFQLLGTTPVSEAIKLILQSRTETVDLSTIRETNQVVGPLALGITPYNLTSTTPWLLSQNLAIAASMELYMNVKGVPVLAPIPTAKAQSPVLVFKTGKGSVITKTLSRTLSEATQYNGVIGIGTGTGGSPVRVTKWTTNPNSPTYAGKTKPTTWGHVPWIFKSDLIPAKGQTTEEAVAQMAQEVDAVYRLVVTAFDVPSFSIVPNAALMEGNCIRLVRPRLGIDKNYIVTGFTIPVTPATAMTVQCRGPQNPPQTID